MVVVVGDGWVGPCTLKVWDSTQLIELGNFILWEKSVFQFDSIAIYCVLCIGTFGDKSMA